MKKQILVFIIFVMTFSFLSFKAYADSPITSTDFSLAYQDVPIVKQASKSKEVNKDIAAYLLNSKNPIDKKAAVINAISWDKSSKRVDTYCKLAYKKSLSAININTLSGDQLFCIGYLYAMDNYFNTKDALKYLKLAEKKLPQSYTVSIVRALVEAQDADKMWNIIQSVKNNKKLKIDMRQDAQNIIYSYMALYSENVVTSQDSVSISLNQTYRVYLYGSYYKLEDQLSFCFGNISVDKFQNSYLELTAYAYGDSDIVIKGYSGATKKIHVKCAPKSQELVNLVAYKDSVSGKYGYKDKSGIPKIVASYDECREFSEGLAAVCLDNKWGFINSSGIVVVDLMFDSVKDYKDGLSTTTISDSEYTINKDFNFIFYQKQLIQICKFDNEGTLKNGTVYLTDGTCKYIGSTENNFSGSGNFIYDNGDCYQGEVTNFIPNGIGTYTWLSGDSYTGEILDGSITGSGKLIYVDGTVQEGIWKDGELIK